MNKLILGAFLVVMTLAGDHLVDAHGMLWDPPSRATLWRFSQYAQYDPEPNYTDNQLFCGGFAFQWQEHGGKCGICGDPYDAPQPRPHEGGGIYGKGIITGRYKSGSAMRVTINLTAAHKGYFELKLCPHNDPLAPASQECLDKYPLEVIGANTGSRFYLPRNEADMYTYDVQLPQGVTCEQCVLQWHYNTGNSWGVDPDGTSCMGCGPQENFRACSDIQIY